MDRFFSFRIERSRSFGAAKKHKTTEEENFLLCHYTEGDPAGSSFSLTKLLLLLALITTNSAGN